MREFAAAAATLKPTHDPVWREAAVRANADYVAWLQTPAMPGALDLGAAVTHLRDVLPRDAILCNGAGNHTVWLHRFYQYGPYGSKEFRTQLAPTSGAMGYAPPSPPPAEARPPERTALALCGDGNSLMPGQAPATAAQYGGTVTCLEATNGTDGTIHAQPD